MRTYWLLPAIVFGMMPVVAQQQDGSDTLYNLPPVLVTAAQAKERETPVTFSSLNQKELQRRYTLQDAPVILSELPSITFYSENGNGIGYSYINLRGFDQRRLSIMVNGVPQNDPEDHQVYWIDMPDLFAYTQNIQVQRGAGNSMYGPPAVGGSINIVTTPVNLKPQVIASSGFGFQQFGADNTTVLNTRKYSLAFSSGFIESRYEIYGHLSKIMSDGYRLSSWTDLGSYFFGVERFDEGMTTRVHVYGGPVHDALSYVGLPKYYNNDLTLRRSNYSYWEFDSTGTHVGYATVQKLQTVEEFSQPHYELIHDWKLSSQLSLHNTAFYIQGEGYYDYDGDWVWSDPVATSWFHSIVGYDSTFGSVKFPSLLLRGFVGNKQWGWLPRLTWHHPQGEFTFGGELRFHRSVHWGSIPFASEYPSSAYNPDFHFYEYNGEKDMGSLYGNEVFHLDDATTLLADLQVAYDRYGIHNEKFLHNDFDVSYVFVNPRIGVNKNLSSQWNAYASLAYTSREPRLTNLYEGESAWDGATPQFESVSSGGGSQIYLYDKPLVHPEHLLDTELGGKYIFERGSVSGNVYLMEFHDELVKSGKIDIFGASVLINAEHTRHAGLECEGSFRLTDDVEISGNATLSWNRIISDKFFDVQDSVYRSLEGNPVAGFPDVLANVRLTYGLNAWSVSGLVKYVGPFHTDNLDDTRNIVDAFTVFDLDASWQIPQFVPSATLRLTGKVTNLFNRLYLASGEGSAFFPAAERNYYIGITTIF